MPLWAVACIFFFRFFIVFYISELLVLQTNYVLNKQILQFLGLKPAVWISFFRFDGNFNLLQLFQPIKTSTPVRQDFVTDTKVIHTKYSKHRPSTVAHTFECVCSKINHGLNHGLFTLLLKLINCPIHWIVCVLAYLDFIFEF